MNLTDADVRWATFDGIVAPCTDLSGVQLEAAVFRDMVTHRCLDLRGATAATTDFQGLPLQAALTAGLDAPRSNLNDQDLGGLDFAGASLAEASMFRVVARVTEFSGADLSGARIGWPWPTWTEPESARPSDRCSARAGEAHRSSTRGAEGRARPLDHPRPATIASAQRAAYAAGPMHDPLPSRLVDAGHPVSLLCTSLVVLSLSGCGGATPAGTPEGAPGAGSLTAAAGLPNGNERLDHRVAPTRYRLDLSLDPSRDTTQGRMEIDLVVNAATREIRLHADRLTIRSATLRHGDAPARPAQVVSGPHGGLSLRLETDLPVGPASVSIDFQGPLGEVPEGVYRVREGDAWYAYTQFEPLEARSAFPCFDQPDFKVPWELVLRVPPAQKAFANTPESARRLEDGQQVVTFRPTAPLPSYLIAFAVGPLDVLEAPAGSASTPLRIITTAGRAKEAAYALRETPRILASLESWFGRPYPYEKLDLVAVPNFSAGAMENAGLVTFREKLLLLDEKSATGARAGMFGVVAHELAHMWFGDLVTMVWWDDLWLNEAFATWMGNRTVQEVAPEFENDIDQAAGAAGVISLDAQPSTRAIRQPIAHGGDVYNAFDGITYGKGSLVLGMLESTLGAEKFRDGVRLYLEEHAGGNATTADLVSALSRASGVAISPIVESFTTRPGTPMVAVSVECEPGSRPRLKLHQSRYRPLDGQAPEVSPWTLPMCVRYATAGSEAVRQCFVLDGAAGADAVVPLEKAESCPLWLHPNADERGYYRWTLPDAQREALFSRKGVPVPLTLRERVVIPALTGAWLESGGLTIAQAIELSLDLGSETHRTLLSAAFWGMRGPFRLLGEQPDARLTARLDAAFGPHLLRLGMEPKPAENADVRFLRNSLVNAFADMTASQAVLEKARKVAEAFLRAPSDVDPELAGLYVPIAATIGDLTLWTRFRELLKSPLGAGERDTVLRALGSFRGPGLLERSLALGLDDTLRAQDLRGLLYAGGGRDTTRHAAWRWLTANYDAVVARIGDKSSPSLPFVGASFCDAVDRAAVEAFFAGPRGRVEGTERNLKLTLENIDRCMAFKKRHQAGAQAWLEKQGK